MLVAYKISIKNLEYHINEKMILSDIHHEIQAGTFTALLGENGSGKSTLLDLIMGFKIPKKGEILIEEKDAHSDDLTLKANTLYLSEKMEVPVYWKIGDYLEFHKHFYKNYSDALEEKYLNEYKIKKTTSFRSLSAGENKRAQIVAALSSQPQLVLVDEITAVLDIVGRQKFMSHLSELCKNNCTVIMATNILENIENYTTHLMLLHKGKVNFAGKINDFVTQQKQSPFINQIASVLEAA